uniref:Uncharacterized protein n=1 Tax=Triticum urartu TaxID=4572 RepID=A0A8R7UAJ4_TRIUA
TLCICIKVQYPVPPFQICNSFLSKSTLLNLCCLPLKRWRQGKQNHRKHVDYAACRGRDGGSRCGLCRCRGRDGGSWAQERSTLSEHL